MTVASELNHNQYVGNGVTTDFDYKFRIFKSSHILVQVSDLSEVLSTLVLNTDYTVTGVGTSGGGKVVLSNPLPDGWSISLDRNLPVVQETDLRNQGTFYAETHEDAFDYLTMLIQRTLSFFSLALRKPSFISKLYDALTNRIVNLGDPVNPQDAATKNYTDSLAQSNLNKTLRVPDNYIDPLPPLAQLEGRVIAIVSGRPVGIPVPSGSAAAVLIELAKPTGSTLIGTNHRGTLALDLNAMDRRPDGYGNSISNVLSNGKDVQVEKDISISQRIRPLAEQVISGAGGKINVTTSGEPAIYTDARQVGESRDRVRISDVKIQGSVVPDGVAAYGVFYRDTEGSYISGLNASGFTGGAIIINSSSSITRDVRATNMIYHPSSVAGGYGVILDETRQAIIDGVQFDAAAGNIGRHLLYISRSGGNGNAYDGCQNTIATNLIAKYRSKDDRNFWAINSRKNQRSIINNVIIDGANGGVSTNVENGNIENCITYGVIASVEKYQNGVGVYAVSQTRDDTLDYRPTGFLDGMMILSSKPKNSSLTGDDCICYSLAGMNGMLTSLITNSPTTSSPITIQPGCRNVQISNITDYISDGATGTPAAMITFTGSAGTCSNINVRGVKTARNMFARLIAVIDLTVDYTRQVRINVASGVASKTDPHELIPAVSSITVGTSSITIAFAPHVTQNAIEDCQVSPITGAQFVVASTTNKTLVINTYSLSGATLNPQITNTGVKVVLNS